jgi:gliding motility-associated-like protein
MRLLQVRKTCLEFLLLVLALSLGRTSIFAQPDEEPPVSPVLTLVSINQTSGDTELRWTVSTSPDVAGYIVYLYEDDAGFALDTVLNPSATGYSTHRPYSFIRSESFVVAAIDDSVNVSPLSNVINTIFCEVKVDTCKKTISVAWNKYPSYPSKVTGYDILRSVNGSIYTTAGQVGADDNTFVTSDFVNGSKYCFAVKAKLENGQSSYSNIACVTAKIRKSPLWINADFATVTVYDDISLAFSIDPESEIDLFSLERKTGKSGSFEQIAQIRTTVKSITYFDQDADPAKTNFYRLSAINSCGLKELSSNIASNIVLSTERGSGNDIILRWNSYYKWMGTVASYRLYMDTGTGFSQRAEIEPADTVYFLDISDIMHTITADIVCFYVLASESSNPYGVAGESISNKSCFTVEETITVPNLFTPNGDLRNDMFGPVLTFTPAEYYLVICNRQGKVVFETRDFTEAWDGSDGNKPVTEGVYLWFIKARTNSGRNISKTGTITVYNNK